MHPMHPMKSSHAKSNPISLPYPDELFSNASRVLAKCLSDLIAGKHAKVKHFLRKNEIKTANIHPFAVQQNA
jgi:hypothetical protein